MVAEVRVICVVCRAKFFFSIVFFCMCVEGVRGMLLCYCPPCDWLLPRPYALTRLYLGPVFAFLLNFDELGPSTCVARDRLLLDFLYSHSKERGQNVFARFWQILVIGAHIVLLMRVIGFPSWDNLPVYLRLYFCVHPEVPSGTHTQPLWQTSIIGPHIMRAMHLAEFLLCQGRRVPPTSPPPPPLIPQSEVEGVASRGWVRHMPILQS